LCLASFHDRKVRDESLPGMSDALPSTRSSSNCRFVGHDPLHMAGPVTTPSRIDLEDLISNELLHVSIPEGQRLKNPFCRKGNQGIFWIHYIKSTNTSRLTTILPPHSGSAGMISSIPHEVPQNPTNLSDNGNRAGPDNGNRAIPDHDKIPQ
jgi:hypothetical protein